MKEERKNSGTKIVSFLSFLSFVSLSAGGLRLDLRGLN